MATTSSASLRVSALALALVGCGFSEPVPGSMPSVGGSNAATAGTGGIATPMGGAAGSAVTVGGGGTSAGQGGQVDQGGTAPVGGSGGGASGGTGGMSVAGGPPAFSNKPLSVVAYSPYRNGQGPGGAQPTQAQVREDLELLKPLVDGVRVYGTDGAQAYIPALCDELGIDLHMGCWIDGLASDEPNCLQLAGIVNENHPSLKTAIIGNEVLARSTKNMMTEEKLIAIIETTKAAITNKTVKIAAADTFPQWQMNRPNLANSVDLMIWHTYGWWSGADIANAYALVSMRYDLMLALYPGKDMLLGETGWPSMFDHMSTDLTTTAVGSEANQARFYREALAGFRARNLRVWMFSAIDEQWKATSGEGMVGAWWGFYTTARMPKQAATEMLMMLQ
jgi:glucan 1,3-beta-glucosidase